MTSQFDFHPAHLRRGPLCLPCADVAGTLYIQVSTNCRIWFIIRRPATWNFQRWGFSVESGARPLPLHRDVHFPRLQRHRLCFFLSHIPCWNQWEIAFTARGNSIPSSAAGIWARWFSEIINSGIFDFYASRPHPFVFAHICFISAISKASKDVRISKLAPIYGPLESGLS